MLFLWTHVFYTNHVPVDCFVHDVMHTSTRLVRRLLKRLFTVLIAPSLPSWIMMRSSIGGAMKSFTCRINRSSFAISGSVMYSDSDDATAITCTRENQLMAPPPIITAPLETVSGWVPYFALTHADSLTSPPIFRPLFIPMSFVRYRYCSAFQAAIQYAGPGLSLSFTNWWAVYERSGRVIVAAYVRAPTASR